MHLAVDAGYTLVEFTNPAELDERAGNARVSRVARLAHVVERHDVGQRAGTHDFQAVVKHRDAHVVAAKSVISMGHSIDKTFKPRELRIFRHGLKFAIGTKKLEIAKHTGNERIRPFDNLGQRAAKRALLCDIEPLARLHPHAVVAQHAHARLRHHDRRVLSEQQRASDR